MVAETLHGLSFLLARRTELLAELVNRRRVVEHWRGLAAATVAGAALYGAALGSWRNGQVALYDAVKLPAVLVLTVLLTMPFHWMIARLLGAALELAQVGALTALSLAIGAVLPASLTPVVMLFTLSSAPPSVEALATYQTLLVAHVLIIGGSCLAGTFFLWRTLRQVTSSTAVAAGIYVAWLTVDALVGGEITWAMRPYIGSVTVPVVFLERTAFQGNFYEAFYGIVVSLLSHPQ